MNKLTTQDALNLGVIVLYSLCNCAREITGEVVMLYLKIVDDLNRDMEYTFYSVISILLDAYYDDEKEYMKIQNMLDNKTSSDSKFRYASQEAILESLNFAKEDLQFSNGKLDAVNRELDMAYKKIAMLEAQNAALNDELKGK